MRSPWIDDVSEAKTPLAFILLISRPYTTYAVFALISIAVASVTGAVQPLIYKHIVDSIGQLLSGGSYQTLCVWVGLYIGSLAGSMLFWRIGNRISAHWVMGVRATGRYGLTNYLLKHSHSYFENRFAGSTANKIAHAADGSKNLVQELVFGIAPFFVAVVMTIVLSLSASLYIGLLFMLWLMIAVPLNYYFAKQRTVYTVRAQESETKLRGSAVDLVTNIRAVQEYARAPHELSLMQRLIMARHDFGLQNWMYGQYVSIINSVLQIVFVALMIGIAILETYKGITTPGTIVLVLALATSVGERLFWLSNEIANIAENWGEIREGLEDLLNDHDVPDAPNAQPLTVGSGVIIFTDVSFSYHEGESVIKDFNLTIASGEKIGLVGRSGAGKSTLVKLLLRHYDLSGGEIAIDGQSIAGVQQDTLRDAISIVPQESLLFHRSIRENIAYGKEGATLDEIYEAAELAQAHEFIKALPDGYDTLVGERGVKLSGGQRQRVAIARALLKPAKILLLDEATSSLDSESEGEIQKGLESLMEGKTVIAIAHRLSTLRAMDRILVLDQGQIVEDGSHDSLVRKKNGVYAGLWKHQSGGYLGDE